MKYKCPRGYCVVESREITTPHGHAAVVHTDTTMMYTVESTDKDIATISSNNYEDAVSMFDELADRAKAWYAAQRG